MNSNTSRARSFIRRSIGVTALASAILSAGAVTASAAPAVTQGGCTLAPFAPSVTRPAGAEGFAYDAGLALTCVGAGTDRLVEVQQLLIDHHRGHINARLGAEPDVVVGRVTSLTSVVLAEGTRISYTTGPLAHPADRRHQLFQAARFRLSTNGVAGNWSAWQGGRAVSIPD